jgi:hypothetical protein
MYQCGPGKHLKFIIEECLKYQILNMSAERDEVEKYLIDNKSAFLEKYS